MSNISTCMVAMATLLLQVRSTLKYLAVTLIRTVNSEAKLVWKFLILTRARLTFSLTYSLVSKVITLPKVSKVFSLFLNAKCNGDEWLFLSLLSLGYIY